MSKGWSIVYKVSLSIYSIACVGEVIRRCICLYVEMPYYPEGIEDLALYEHVFIIIFIQNCWRSWLDCYDERFPYSAPRFYDLGFYLTARYRFLRYRKQELSRFDSFVMCLVLDRVKMENLRKRFLNAIKRK